MNKTFVFLMIIIIFLVGCNVERHFSTNNMKIYIGSGASVKISESEQAEVFGYDTCPISDEDSNYIDKNCVLLKPDSQVNVILIPKDNPEGHFKEKWKVISIVKNGHTAYVLERPNGWQVQGLL